MTQPPRRPRPTPDGSARAGWSAPAVDRPVARVELEPSQVIAAVGTAVGTAARVGTALTRTGWRVARRLPVAGSVLASVEREARRLVSPAETPRVITAPAFTERRFVDVVPAERSGVEPLRGAMAQLLERSVEASHDDTQQYLYAAIMSQLVPDEARIVAALADGSRAAAADVVERRRREPDRVVLANASSIGSQAGLSSPESTPTYLTRLHGLGLVEFGPADDALAVQYDILGAEASVRAARENGARRFESRQLVRKTVLLTPFGTRFWAAADPAADPVLGLAALPPV